jgi:hypothetical protein
VARGIPAIFGAGAARFYAMDKMFGIGWVCENHPDRAWDRELGCECGAGIPCKCNDADEPDTSGVLTEDRIITRH